MPPLPPPPRGCCFAGHRGGQGPLGVGGVPRGLLRLFLEDVGGRLPVFRRGGCMHRVPRQVLDQRPPRVEIVCTQRAFRGLRGPPGRMGYY